MTLYTIEYRRQTIVNTDPQRRCYNGCHARSELRWTEWESLDSGVPAEAVERRLAFWNGLNDYAVSERGPSARWEIRARLENEGAE